MSKSWNRVPARSLGEIETAAAEIGEKVKGGSLTTQAAVIQLADLLRELCDRSQMTGNRSGLVPITFRPR